MVTSHTRFQSRSVCLEDVSFTSPMPSAHGAMQVSLTNVVINNVAGPHMKNSRGASSHWSQHRFSEDVFVFDLSFAVSRSGAAAGPQESKIKQVVGPFFPVFALPFFHVFMFIFNSVCFDHFSFSFFHFSSPRFVFLFLFVFWPLARYHTLAGKNAFTTTKQYPKSNKSWAFFLWFNFSFFQLFLFFLRVLSFFFLKNLFFCHFVYIFH